MIYKINKLFRLFVRSESASGLLLLICTVLALGLANSSWSDLYNQFSQINFGVSLGNFHVIKTIQNWVNDGLMAVFFLLVGLEIKRELIMGELSSFKKACLPIAVALGGMIIPGLIFILINWHSPLDLKGWAIPVATDIAFAMGVLSILGRRIPKGLMVFLAAIAIADDLGAILVIAIFYSHGLSWIFCLIALLIFFVLIILNFLKVRWLSVYLLLGVFLWLALDKSGIHTTIAGVLFAMTIPADSKNNLLEKLEKILLLPVNYWIVPIFVLLNAGISFSGVGLNNFLFSTVTLGIFLGLLLGKPIGIFGTTWILTRLKICSLPENVSMKLVFGMSLLAGIGFTMSIFISGLAFPGNTLNLLDCKLGIFSASLCSAFFGLAWIFWNVRKISHKNQQ